MFEGPAIPPKAPPPNACVLTVVADVVVAPPPTAFAETWVIGADASGGAFLD
jgi:hypothetical protein